MKRETVFTCPPLSMLERIAASMRARNAPRFNVGGELIYLFFVEGWKVQAAYDLGLAPFCLLDRSVCFRVGAA